MAVYITMTIFAVIFSAIANIKTYQKENKKKYTINLKVVAWYISEIILIVVAAIRYDVGQDYMYTYVPYFNGLLRGYANESIEIGFFVLNKIVQVFTQDYAGIFIVCSVIFFHYIYKAIREQSPMPTLSVFLLIGTTYYFIFLNAMRQMIVVAIFLYAIKFIKERNFKKFLIYMLISSTIHTSALILIPLYFLYGIKLRPLKAIIIALVAIIAKPIVSQIIITLLQYTKYNYYIDSRFDTNEMGYIVLAMNICVLIFALIYYRKKTNSEPDYDNEEKDDDKQLKDYSFYCILQLVSTIIAWYNNVIPLLNRVRWGTGISIIILIPLVIMQEKNIKTRRMYIFAITLLYTIYAIYTIGVTNANSVLPYMTIFQRGG